MNATNRPAAPIFTATIRRYAALRVGDSAAVGARFGAVIAIDVAEPVPTANGGVLRAYLVEVR